MQYPSKATLLIICLLVSSYSMAQNYCKNTRIWTFSAQDSCLPIRELDKITDNYIDALIDTRQCQGLGATRESHRIRAQAPSTLQSIKFAKSDSVQYLILGTVTCLRSNKFSITVRYYSYHPLKLGREQYERTHEFEITEEELIRPSLLKKACKFAIEKDLLKQIIPIKISLYPTLLADEYIQTKYIEGKHPIKVDTTQQTLTYFFYRDDFNSLKKFRYTLVRKHFCDRDLVLYPQMTVSSITFHQELSPVIQLDVVSENPRLYTQLKQHQFSISIDHTPQPLRMNATEDQLTVSSVSQQPICEQQEGVIDSKNVTGYLPISHTFTLNQSNQQFKLVFPKRNRGVTFIPFSTAFNPKASALQKGISFSLGGLFVGTSITALVASERQQQYRTEANAISGNFPTQRANLLDKANSMKRLRNYTLTASALSLVGSLITNLISAKKPQPSIKLKLTTYSLNPVYLQPISELSFYYFIK